MAEQDPNAPLMPKFVGKGVGAPEGVDPQWWLAGSTNPYAPFVGNALKWESYAYDDGTTYEGLMMVDVPHGKGVLVFGNGLGGGIQKAKRADRYEGEFEAGFAHGLGQYTSTDGKVYKGEYLAGARHGCGQEHDMTPFLKLVEKGMDPDAAWAEAGAEVEKKVKRGTWLNDVFHTGPDESGRWCHLHEIRGTVEEVDSVVAKARMFQYKPDGEVTIRFAQDAHGLPAPLMQDPLHYPHGTKFLAPGPMGQCHPIPDDESIKAAMLRAADVHKKVYEQYNLPYNPEPGSVMERAMKAWRRKQARKQKAMEKRLQREAQKIRRMQEADEEDSGKKGPPPPPAAAPPAVEAEEEFDDDDLIASTLGLAREQQQQQAGASAAAAGSSGRGFQPPSIVASASVGLTRAAAALQAAFHRAAITAPPRRSLTRPSDVRRDN